MLEKLRSLIGFKRTPMQCGPDDSAFIGFIEFAGGDSDEAKVIQHIFDTGHAVPTATPEQNTALFIDWLIQNHWGEAPANDQQEA